MVIIKKMILNFPDKVNVGRGKRANFWDEMEGASIFLTLYLYGG